MKEGLRRWAPLAGVVVLVAIVVLRLLGMNDLAQTLEQLGGVVGLTGDSPVGLGELAAAAAALTGVLIKIRNEWRKARSLK